MGPDRRCLVVQISGQGLKRNPDTDRTAPKERSSDRLEGPGATLQTIPTPDIPRQERQSRRDRDRKRDARLHVGDRTRGTDQNVNNQHSESRQRRGPGHDATLGNVKRRVHSTLAPRLRKASDGTSKVVTNPRISAGSTVAFTGPASVPARCLSTRIAM